MDKFVARQPIFDRDGGVSGYELLFRSGPQNFFPQVDPSFASASILHDSVHVFGLDVLSGSRPIYVNVTRETLLDGLVSLLPPERTYLEILETVSPEREIITACERFKSQGYGIALDDFVFRPGYEPLIALADVLKIDFVATKGDARRAVVERFARPGVRFLAEKVETGEELAQAKAFGYSLFQGYFFCRPEMIAARDVPAFKTNYLRLLGVVAGAKMDFARVEAHVKADPAVSLKLLRYLNSAALAVRRRVTSIQQALVLLGEDALRKWIALLSVTALGGDKPTELVVCSLVRASFCERLAPHLRLASLDLFLLGMLSLADVLLGRPLVDVLDSVAIEDPVRSALTSGTGRLGHVLALAVAYERGVWDDATASAKALGLDDTLVADAHRDAVAWACNVVA